MTKWKAGDIIGLRVMEVTKHGWPKVLTMSGMVVVDQAFIEPLPRAMTAAEAALVERMIDRRLDPKCPGNRFSIETGEFVDAVITERVPHDPLVELKALARTFFPSDRETMFAAIARLEAKMKEPKQ